MGLPRSNIHIMIRGVIMKKNVRLIKSICLAFMLMLATVIPYTAVTANSTGVVINTTTQDANPTDSLINGMDG